MKGVCWDPVSFLLFSIQTVWREDYSFWQGSDASTTSSLCGSGPSCTQKAEGTNGGRQAQSANQRSVNGYAYENPRRVFSSVVRCIEWHLPPLCRSGVGVGTCVTLSLVDLTDLLFLYMFFLSSPCFLSQHAPPGPACCGCALRCRFIRSPSLAVDHANSKLLLTWGSSMAFLFLFSPLSPPHPCLCFLTPLQAFKSNARRSPRWLMHQGWFPMEGIPLMKRMEGHTRSKTDYW